MAKQTRSTLKGYFETGDTPSQVQYADLIDSKLNLSEGNTGDIQLTGSITASGNISASGTIVANKIESDRLFSRVGDANTGIQLSSDTVVIEGNNVDIGKFTSTYIELNKHVTASGHISASGDLIGTLQNKGDGTSTGHITFDSSKGLRFVDSSQAIYGSSNSITVESDDYLLVNADIYTSFNTPKLWATGYAQVDGYVSGSSLISETHITASGNISASGTITGNNLLIDGSQVDFSNLPTSDPGVAGRLFSNNIYVKISQG